MITFDHVTKTFGKQGEAIHAVNEVSMTINQGEIFGVIGFSGAGKSTLLRLVNLLERPTSGKILVNGTNVATLSEAKLRKLRRKIGMIFQSFNLFNSRTVFGNVAYPLKLANVPKKQLTIRVNELLRFVGLEDKAKHYPEQLSGGQKQRVGIARALATSPDILICDEATSALDPDTTNEILQLLRKVNEQYNITILLITHEMHVIKSICHRVAVMEKGTVIEEGNVYDIFSNPQTKTTKSFISSVLNDQFSSNLLEKFKIDHNSSLYRVIFTGPQASEPLLSQVTVKHGIHFNIIYGSIHELQDKLFGNLIVDFQGPSEKVEKVIHELDQLVQVKEVIGHEG